MDSTELTIDFQIDDIVVYPSQGIGRIIALEDRKGRQYFRIKIDSSNMDLLLPIDNASKLGLRHLSSKKEIDSVLDYLSTIPAISNSDWKTRVNENQNLLKSGEVQATARVVNTLYRRSKQKELPTLERKLYEDALSLLVDELSSVLGLNSEDTRRTIFARLEQLEG